MPRRHPYLYFLGALLLFLPGGCATLPKDVERPVSYALTDTDDTRVGKALHDDLASHPGKSGFHLLGNGLDAFVARQASSEYPKALRASALADKMRNNAVDLHWGDAEVVYDQPEKIITLHGRSKRS